MLIKHTLFTTTLYRIHYFLLITYTIKKLLKYIWALGPLYLVSFVRIPPCHYFPVMGARMGDHCSWWMWNQQMYTAYSSAVPLTVHAQWARYSKNFTDVSEPQNFSTTNKKQYIISDTYCQCSKLSVFYQVPKVCVCVCVCVCAHVRACSPLPKMKVATYI